MLDEQEIVCPYCWQSFSLPLEPADTVHVLSVDCEICCRPIALTVGADGLQTVDRES